MTRCANWSRPFATSNSSYGRPIGILVDLQGPKLRVGSFAEGSIQLKNGESFVLDSDKAPGDNSPCPAAAP